MCLEVVMAVDEVVNMSDPNKPYHNKGVGIAFIIIAFTMLGIPVIIGTSMGWFNLFGILGL